MRGAAAHSQRRADLPSPLPPRAERVAGRGRGWGAPLAQCKRLSHLQIRSKSSPPTPSAFATLTRPTLPANGREGRQRNRPRIVMNSHSDDPQAEVFAFLGDPTTHGMMFADEEVKRIDTHAAVIFLAGNQAFKVKRRVRFPYLDFSTLEKRKAACEAELAVNRALAPELYRGVVPITREENGELALAGAGTPVEWAVEMARFDETATLDQVAERGELDLALADTLARVVAAAHA